MTQKEKKLYVEIMAIQRRRYMWAHPDEMTAIDILDLKLHLLALKIYLKLKYSHYGI